MLLVAEVVAGLLRWGEQEGWILRLGGRYLSPLSRVGVVSCLQRDNQLGLRCWRRSDRSGVFKPPHRPISKTKRLVLGNPRRGVQPARLDRLVSDDLMPGSGVQDAAECSGDQRRPAGRSIWEPGCRNPTLVAVAVTPFCCQYS
jgi:hypothetical protein